MIIVIAGTFVNFGSIGYNNVCRGRGNSAISSQSFKLAHQAMVGWLAIQIEGIGNFLVGNVQFAGQLLRAVLGITAVQ